jgi:hypothetical protein
VRPGYYYERLTPSTASTSPPRPRVPSSRSRIRRLAILAIGIGPTTDISGLIVRHGSADQGGGLYAVASSPKFTNCVFAENVAVLGGGAYLRDGSQASFVNCAFVDNLATVGGGVPRFRGGVVASCDIGTNDASDAPRSPPTTPPRPA